MTTPGLAQSTSRERTRPQRLWVWFLAGFLIVSVCMLLLVTTYYMHPSGRGIIRTKLWKYYLVQIPRLFSPKLLGPATGDSSATVTILFQHVICAGLGGIVALGIGWAFNKFRRVSGCR